MCVVLVASQQRGGLRGYLLYSAIQLSWYLIGCVTRSCRRRRLVERKVKNWKLRFGVHINMPLLNGHAANDDWWVRQTATRVTALLSMEAWLDSPTIQENDALLNCVCFYVSWWCVYQWRRRQGAIVSMQLPLHARCLQLSVVCGQACCWSFECPTCNWFVVPLPPPPKKDTQIQEN